MEATRRPSARERLLAAADRVLFTAGVRATPVDALLREADVSAATLYTHFASKDGLVAEALRVRLREWRAVWDAQVVEATDDEGRLLAVFDALSAFRRGAGTPARWCAFLATADELPAAGGEIAAVLAADTELCTSRLRRLAEPLAGDEAEELAAEVLVAYDGTLAAFLRGHPHKPIEVGRRLAATAVRARRATP